MRIYIAGPMRGIPFFNAPLFAEVENTLKLAGHEVFNPARKDQQKYGVELTQTNPTGDESKSIEDFAFDLRDALAMDLDWICRKADAMMLLPNWEKSKGASAERAVAEALGLKIMLWTQWKAINYVS